MRNIQDKVTLRGFCLSEAVKVYETELKHGRSTYSVLDAAKSFEEYISDGIDLPDHAHYPDTFLTINNNNCPCAFEEEDDEGIGFN